MSNADTPAENTGGNTATSMAGKLAELPPRVRVHALAKLFGSNSREVLAKLTELGESTRSAQSSVTRDVALRLAEALGLTDEQPVVATPESSPVLAEMAAPVVVEEQPVVETASVHTEPVQESVVEEAPIRRRRAHMPVFAAPSPTFLPPEPIEAPVRRQQPEPEPITEELEDERQLSHGSDQGDDDGDESGRRRRRRGRRGRGRGKGGDEGGLETDEEQAPEPSQKRERGRNVRNAPAVDEADTEEDEKHDDAPVESQADADADADGDDAGNKRRRRRRRRKGGDDGGEDSAADAAGTTEDDPPNTVVHVRQSKGETERAERPERERAERPARDEVRSVRGSTRLEAKRQRRRDGREAGRRRAPILSEAEFLARRESVERTMVVLEKGDSTQIGVLEDGVLVEHFVTDSSTGSIVGNVYLGRVQNVLPSMEAAFIDIGRGRNAVLYAGEVDWDAAGLEGKARKIEQALSSGDSVLVQVTKDPVGHKGARLTTQISLAGRFLVYVPAGGATGISRKLPENERRRLKDILKRIVPEDAGVIIRTASEGVSEEELARDVNRLTAQWSVIKEKADAGTANGKKSSAPTMLYEEPDLLVKVVRDLFTEDFSTLEIQGNTSWDTIHGYVKHVAPDLESRLKRYTGTGNAFSDHRIDEQITKALDRKVWLPSGGYLVIDRTEAMTVIDVNTGKYTGSGGNLEETVTRNNLESAEEIVRQLRLRDIGGIIVIDFIDMVLESNRELVLRRLTECLGRDRTRHQVAEVTSLGLVQMTRKKIGTGLIEAFSTPCEHCKGRGVVVSTEPQRISGGTQNGNGHSHPSAPSGPSSSGTSGGGQQQPSRRSRGRGKGEESGQDDTLTVTRTEPVAPAPTPEQRESVVSAVQAIAQAAKVAKSEDEHPVAEESAAPAEQAETAQLNGHAHAPEPEVVQEPAAPMVTGRVGGNLAKEAEAAAEAEEAVPEVEVPVPATRSTRRRPRRAASRPAGPPVSAETN
ncbi:MAG: ribonuclease [Actinomycetota bacterium]|jgi:ribonuclease E|nr:ribonuclease [Actinomycetota bacterium]